MRALRGCMHAPLRPMPRLLQRVTCRAKESQRERSTHVAEETVCLLFQLDLDVQLQRSLNMAAYDMAKEIRAKRQMLDEAIAAMAERKAAKIGASNMGGQLSFTDFASEGLRLRSEMQRAVEAERYQDAASFKTLLSELEKESKRSQAAASEAQISKLRLRLGQRVVHQSEGYQGVVVGWDRQCCESEDWINTAQCEQFREEPFYHVLVDERAWGLDDETDMPPAAYVPEALLTAPELEPQAKSWCEVCRALSSLGCLHSHKMRPRRDFPR